MTDTNVNVLDTFDVARYEEILSRGLSKGMGDQDGQMCIEAAICSTLGLQWLDTRTGQVQESGPTSEKSDSSMHCSACITHLTGLPPATSSAIFFDFSNNSAPTRLVVVSAPTRLPTNQANPRAPPLLA